MNHPPRNIDLTCFNWVKLILKTDLPANAKFIGLYLSTYMNLNQDMAYPGLKRIEAETGLAHAIVLKQIGLLVEEGWLLKQSGNRVSTNQYWINIPSKIIAEVGQIGVGQPLTYVNSGAEVGQPLTSNNNTNNNTLSKRFTPPTVEEVTEYCRAQGYGVDPETFVDWNKSKGWIVGRSPMKDWRAAIRTWEKREKQNGKSGQSGRSNTRVKTVSLRHLID